MIVKIIDLSGNFFSWNETIHVFCISLTKIEIALSLFTFLLLYFFTVNDQNLFVFTLFYFIPMMKKWWFQVLVIVDIFVSHYLLMMLIWIISLHVNDRTMMRADCFGDILPVFDAHVSQGFVTGIGKFFVPHRIELKLVWVF